MLHWAFHTLTVPLGHQHRENQTIHTVCHLVAPLGKKCLFNFLDWLTVTFVCLFVCVFDWPCPGWAFPWWSWPVWLECATCWPRTSGWDGTCEPRPEAERDILGPLEAFSSTPRWKWPRLGQFTGNCVKTMWRRRLEGQRCCRSFQAQLRGDQ